MSVLRISGMGAGVYVKESPEEIVKLTEDAFASGARTIKFTLVDKMENEAGTIVVATANVQAVAAWHNGRGVHMDGTETDDDG